MLFSEDQWTVKFCTNENCLPYESDLLLSIRLQFETITSNKRWSVQNVYFKIVVAQRWWRWWIQQYSLWCGCMRGKIRAPTSWLWLANIEQRSQRIAADSKSVCDLRLLEVVMAVMRTFWQSCLQISTIIWETRPPRCFSANKKLTDYFTSNVMTLNKAARIWIYWYDLRWI